MTLSKVDLANLNPMCVHLRRLVSPRHFLTSALTPADQSQSCCSANFIVNLSFSWMESRIGYQLIAGISGFLIFHRLRQRGACSLVPGENSDFIMIRRSYLVAKITLPLLSSSSVVRGPFFVKSSSRFRSSLAIEPFFFVSPTSNSRLAESRSFGHIQSRREDLR